MGIGRDDWFVCICGRDPNYMGQRVGFGWSSGQRLFKDCTIENYLDATRWIVEQEGQRG